MQRIKAGIFYVFIGMMSFYQCRGMGVIVINGISCSGKSAIAKACIDLFGSDGISIVSVDKIKMRRSEDLDCRDRLHVATIRKIKTELERGNLVICDTVLDEQQWIDLFKSKLAGIKVCFVFVHCPLNILAQRLIERNRQAKAVGDMVNCRNFSQILLAFGRMYQRVALDTGIGIFTEQDFDSVKMKGPGGQLSPYDWNALTVRFDVFDYRAGNKLNNFLKIKLDYDFIVHNYSESQVLPKDEFIRTIAGQIIRAFPLAGKIIT